MRVKRVIDISRKIYPGMAVWPGDRGFVIIDDCRIEQGAVSNVSSIEMGVHTGTHIDAPFHFINQGKDISSLNLLNFVGIVKVFELCVEKCVTRQGIEDLPINKGDAVFFKTLNSKRNDGIDFFEEYIYLDAKAAEFLVEKGIRTLGMDALSIDAFETSDYPAHRLFLSNDIGVIEGLELQNVQEGAYFFSCLPLNIPGVDGSPTRAVLMELE
jgi:arylformamidase